jgi:hypothetical protein
VICDKSVDIIDDRGSGPAEIAPHGAVRRHYRLSIIPATVLAEWPMALVGAMTAMVLSFADDDGPLSARLAMLALRVRDFGGRARLTPNSGQARENAGLGNND